MRVWVFSTFASALIMFILSYLWHDLILPDFEKLSIPLTKHLLILASVYMLIGLLMVAILKNSKKRIGTKFYGILIGILFGVAFYSIILLYSDSYTKNFIFHSFQKKHIFLDYGWQIVEQGFGGLIAARSILFFGAWKKSF